MEAEQDVIKQRFKSGFWGIVQNSNGFRELILTRFNVVSLIITIFIVVLYLSNIKTTDESFKLITNLNSTIISLLSGIVGLNLAGLTIIMTFTNPEIVDDGALKQYNEFIDTGKVGVSYFQIVIAKFSFMVLFQTASLLFFIVSITVGNLNIKVDEQIAYRINTCVFSFSMYLIVFSVVLVIALILNLFTFSQTSNFVKFMKRFTTSDCENNENDRSSN